MHVSRSIYSIWSWNLKKHRKHSLLLFHRTHLIHTSSINQLTLNFQPLQLIRSLTKIFSVTRFLTSYTDWSPGEPEIKEGLDCVGMWTVDSLQWATLYCSSHFDYVCRQVCRETNSLSVAVNLFTVDHNNNKILWLVLLLSYFPMNTLKVGMVSFSAQQAICDLNIWTIEETFLWREKNIIMSLNSLLHALGTFRAPDEAEIWENELFLLIKSGWNSSCSYQMSSLWFIILKPIINSARSMITTQPLSTLYIYQLYCKINHEWIAQASAHTSTHL